MFYRKIAIFQSKILIIQIATEIHNLKDNIMKRFLENSPIIAYSKNIIFVWVGKPDLKKDRWKSKVKTQKYCHFSREARGNCFKFAMER